MRRLPVLICMAVFALCGVALAAEPVTPAAAGSPLAWVIAHYEVLLGLALAVSEALALIPGVRANGIFDAIFKGLQSLKGKPASGIGLMLVAALGVGMLSGCAGLRNNQDMATAGKALLTVKGTIVSAAITADRLCDAKALSVDTCTRSRDAYATAKTAYDAAVDSYLLLQSGGGDPAAFAATLHRLESLATNLTALAGGAK